MRKSGSKRSLATADIAATKAVKPDIAEVFARFGVR
jgi:lipoprotein NlpI